MQIKFMLMAKRHLISVVLNVISIVPNYHSIPIHPISGLLANPAGITILSFCIIPINLPGGIFLVKYAAKAGLAGTSGTKHLPYVLNHYEFHSIQ